MKFSKQYIETYQNLPEKLTEIYPDLNFENHCYLRIALDNAVRAKWDTVLKRPAYKNLNQLQLQEVLSLLHKYQTDKSLLLHHNTLSLKWRQKRR